MSEDLVNTAADIWPGLAGTDEHGSYLIGGRCEECGATSLGVREICPGCWSRGNMVPIPVGRVGRIYSCTVIHQVPDGFDGPITVGYVDLPEGLRAFAHLDASAGRPQIGEDVELRLVPLRRDAQGRMLSGPLYSALFETEAAA